jgi:uncharacterized membrane protein
MKQHHRGQSDGLGKAEEQSIKARRLAIAGLGVLGVADSLYMLAYHEGLIDSMVCPFFGEGCEIVGRSEHAKHLGIPNAAVGAMGFAGMAALAVWSGNKPAHRRPWRSLGLGLTAGAAGATSAILTWEQAAKVRAWCFWCLLSAGLISVILPLSLADAIPAWRALRSRRKTRK